MKSTRTEFDGYTEEILEPDDPPAATTAKGNGYDPDPWPVLDHAAYHGLVGEIISVLSPQTESDPIALLLQFIVSFGNAIGRKPYYLVEASRHYTNLFAVLVGRTAKSRKGTSAERIRRIVEIADPDWANWRAQGGMSSGEGIIWAVRDPIFSMKKGVEELSDPGIDDKRLLLDEREFFQALSVLKRDGSILSRIVRDAWDCRRCLASMTKHLPARASEALISIVGHITTEELRQTLDHTSMANGYANRFLFACVRRSRLLPHGGCTDEKETERLGQNTREALDTARRLDRVMMREDAYRFWEEIYPTLSEDRPGLLGAITARAEAQTIRLALLYALLDRSPEIARVHLEAALALWRYCDASAHYIFGDLVGDPVADAILRALRNVHPNGMSRSDISGLFRNHLAAGKIAAALVLLQAVKKVRFEMHQPHIGRPCEMWFSVSGKAP
jgi:hypothetical protein